MPTIAMMILFIYSTLVRQTILIPRPAPANKSFLRSSIARMDPHRGQWSWAKQSFPPYHDVGWFQALRLRWLLRQEECE